MRVSDGYMLALKFRGFAALVEQGGRTAAHVIPNAFGRGFTARHPGGPVRADPFFDAAARLSEPDIKAQIAIGLERAAAIKGMLS
jgi:hypothetical protein